MKKPTNNARLEWRGRRLMCNRVEVDRIGMVVTYEEGKVLRRDYNSACDRPHKTLRAARRAINRRFSLPLDFGTTLTPGARE